jgi:hypothetical protein
MASPLPDEDAFAMSAPIEFTLLTKDGGPLTKQISLAPDGSLHSDGSACIMSRGRARRIRISRLGALAGLIRVLPPEQAIALGALRQDLPKEVRITTKRDLEGLTGSVSSDLIARTGNHISYRPGQPALALIDIDTKGMPALVKSKIDAFGGFWAALVSVLPELEVTGRVLRSSTSTGIVRTDTGEHLPGSNGLHAFVLVVDGSDVERFLRTLHERCWLNGLGWMMVGASGQLLDRSIVDRMVGAPERLVFEGKPVLDPPLVQDRTSREPVATEGRALDTIAACSPLSIVENARLKDLRAKDTNRLGSDVAKARRNFISRQSKSLADRTNISTESAARVIERLYAGILLPDVVLPFDDAELAGATVADVLADPARFEGATLADPLEGVAYGACKAKIMVRADGMPWIHSFAHGRSVYELKLDARAVENALKKAPAAENAGLFVRLALIADLDAAEIEALQNTAHERSSTGKRTLAVMLKRARQERVEYQARAERQRRTTERQDPRAYLVAPLRDDERVPVIVSIDEVLCNARGLEPPMRDAEWRPADIRSRPPIMLHELLSVEANTENPAELSRLPAPAMPLLTPHDEYSMAHLIERYIEFYEEQRGGDERTVALDPVFVRHYMKFRGSKLPIVTALVTSPLVLSDGTLLATQGLDRERGIIFRLQPELLALLPEHKDCTDRAIVEAMSFLTQEWLVDVATDYAGKCILIAGALTIPERAILSGRPAFFVTAGQRGGGKTTVLQMLFLATTGYGAAAAAWSQNEEERRKCLFSYLGECVPGVVWDNIPRGLAITCPSIEKSLTAATYSDRVLGVTGTRTVPATTVNFFTGNNITARGDMASRSLQVRLAVHRPDPENRWFEHADPIAWTVAHRGTILRALYILLLGNPRLRASELDAAETRFKDWWHLVGSAVEHAAKLHSEEVTAICDGAEQISFRNVFLAGEADEEQTSSLATVLDVLRQKWPNGCKAREVAMLAGSATEEAIEFKAALEQASGRPLPVITASTINWRLKALKDAPVLIGESTFALRGVPDGNKHGATFVVKSVG